MHDEVAHFRIRMTKSIDSYPRREVQISPILHVPNVASFSFGHDWGRADISRDHVGSILL